MIDKFEALQAFWSRFGLLAFNEETVPDYVPNAKGEMIPLEMPYITYEPGTGSIDGQMTLSGSVWYRGNSWTPICQKVTEIEKSFNCSIPIEGGYMIARKSEDFFAQPMSDPNDSQVRRMNLRGLFEFITN